MKPKFLLAISLYTIMISFFTFTAYADCSNGSIKCYHKGVLVGEIPNAVPCCGFIGCSSTCSGVDYVGIANSGVTQCSQQFPDTSQYLGIGCSNNKCKVDLSCPLLSGRSKKEPKQSKKTK